MLVLFGLYLVASGLRSNEKIEGGWSLRALVVLPLSLVMFGLLMEYAGFVPAPQEALDEALSRVPPAS